MVKYQIITENPLYLKKNYKKKYNKFFLKDWECIKSLKLKLMTKILAVIPVKMNSKRLKKKI